MKKTVILLVVVAVVALASTYPTAGARAFAVSTLNDTSVVEAHYGELLSRAEAKRDWVAAEMAGEQGYLQTEALRIEVRELKRIHSEYLRNFNAWYSLFTWLRLI